MTKREEVLVTKREEVLAKLMRLTWECLPGVLAEDCLLETDVEGLARIVDAVGVVLNGKRVDWKSFDALERSLRAHKGWQTRRHRGSQKPNLRVI